MSSIILCLFLFSLFFLLTNTVTSQYVFAAPITSTIPIVQITPSCHDQDEERINITINGFNKNGSVYWEFINSKGIVDTFGYFSTNSTGGFNDYTIGDDFSYDTYTARFYDDKNNDYIKDVGGVELNSTYSIPCDILVTNNNELNLQSEDIQEKFFIYVNLERIISHLNQALKNLDSKNMDNAFQFAYMPHKSIFTSIKDELQKSNPKLSLELEGLLTDLPIIIDEREDTLPQIQKLVAEINRAIKSASNKIIGTEYLSNSKFILHASIALISDAISVLENIDSSNNKSPQQESRVEYDSELDYQHIDALANRSLYQFQKILNTPGTENNYEERISSILTFFSKIGNYTTNRDKDNTSLLNSLNQLKVELNEYLLSNTNTSTSSFRYTTKLPEDINGYFSNIDFLLHSIVTQVKENNDYKKADKAAISAYLDNYEYLEASIEKINPELMLEIELNMREELRQYLKNNESPEKIELFVTKILQKLDRAENLLLNDSSIAIIPVISTNGSNTVNSNQTGIGLLADIDKLSEGFGTFKGQKKEIGQAGKIEKESVRGDIDTIRIGLQNVLNLYKQEEYEESLIAARSAYLDSYEQIEIPLRPIDPDFTLEMEIKFAELRNHIEKQGPYKEVLTKIGEIQDGLDESERLVSGIGMIAPGIAFSSSFSIVFREGLESAIIIGTILTYLEASRNDRFKKHVYYGIIFAAGATAITWFIAEFVISISGASRELIEAIAGISAVAVLFWVSFWVLNRIETKKWIEFVKSKVWKATTTGSVMVFVFLSFFIVYREGFETVLFYQAMFSYAKHMETYVILGFIIGVSVIVGVAFLVRKIGRRLPLRLLFAVTMGVGAYMSITFLGNAIREFQEIGLISTTHLFGIIPRLDINVATMTGIHPTLETVLGQIILLIVYLIGSLYILVIQPRKMKEIESSRKSMSDLKK